MVAIWTTVRCSSPLILLNPLAAGSTAAIATLSNTPHDRQDDDRLREESGNPDPPGGAAQRRAASPSPPRGRRADPCRPLLRPQSRRRAGGRSGFLLADGRRPDPQAVPDLAGGAAPPAAGDGRRHAAMRR